MSIRRRFPIDPPRTPKPELMADLRTATTTDEIVEALWAFGRRSRGGAEELEFLADHPDPEVREELADLLDSYRGSLARALAARITATLPATSERVIDLAQGSSPYVGGS